MGDWQIERTQLRNDLHEASVELSEVRGERDEMRREVERLQAGLRELRRHLTEVAPERRVYISFVTSRIDAILDADKAEADRWQQAAERDGFTVERGEGWSNGTRLTLTATRGDVRIRSFWHLDGSHYCGVDVLSPRGLGDKTRAHVRAEGLSGEDYCDVSYGWTQR